MSSHKVRDKETHDFTVMAGDVAISTTKKRSVFRSKDEHTEIKGSMGLRIWYAVCAGWLKTVFLSICARNLYTWYRQSHLPRVRLAT